MHQVPRRYVPPARGLVGLPRVSMAPARLSPRFSRRCIALAPWLAAALVLGCMGGGGRPGKQALSALWVDSGEMPQLEPAVLAQLEEVDIREIFLPLAELDFTSNQGPLVRRPIPELDPSLRLNVVVEGRLKLEGLEPKAAADTIAEAMQQLLFDVEARGIVPVGVHFDLRSIDSITTGTTFFKRLRSALDDSFFLSISLRRSWMKAEGIDSLAKSVDFVVPFLYGQRVWERDSDEAWDFSVVQKRLAQLEDAKIPYMVGIIGIGNVTHTDKRGKVKNFTSEQAMHPFMWNRQLKLQRGFSLEATNRRVYTLVAEGSTTAGGWELQPKDEIRLIRPMTTDLDQLLDILADGEYPGMIGQLYYRLPAPGERMSMTIENILNALDPNPVAPDLFFEVQVSRRTRRGAMYRFVISNENGEPSEYSLLDNNYLQITADPNAFGDVKLGDFYRYDLLQMQGDGTYKRMIRQANTMRLHVPILEGEQRVVSGDVEIRRRNPTLLIEASFMLPDGRTVQYGPFTWRDGKLHGQKEREEEAEEGEEGAQESAM